MPGLKAGPYRVNAQSWTAGAQAPEQKIDLTGDRAVEVVLPSGRLAGRVVASGTEQPLGNARVSSVKSTSPDGSFGLTHDATTDDAGRFQLTGLESGSLTLSATRKGYVVETRAVTADASEDLVIALARGDGLDVTGRDGLLGTPLSMLCARGVRRNGSGRARLTPLSTARAGGRSHRSSRARTRSWRREGAVTLPSRTRA